jgi:hypothetical protein
VKRLFSGVVGRYEPTEPERPGALEATPQAISTPAVLPTAKPAGRTVRAKRLLDELFEPTDDFIPPMGPPVIKPVTNKLDSLLAKKPVERGATDYELAERARIKKEKAVAAKQAFRARRKEQLAKAKQAGKIPLAELRALAEKRKQQEQLAEENAALLARMIKNPNAGMYRGERLTDATSEERELARPTTGWRSNSTNSEMSNFDLIINHVGNWDENQDARSSQAEGAGADSDESRKDASEGDPVDSGLGRKFHADLDVDASQFSRVLIEFDREYYIEDGVDVEGYCKTICKLCWVFIDHPDEHTLEVHGNPNDPYNLLAKMRRKIEKKDREWREKAKQLGPLPGTAKATARDALRQGYVQKGNWIQIPGGKWIQEYTNKPRPPKRAKKPIPS